MSEGGSNFWQRLARLDARLSARLRLAPGQGLWRPAAILAHSGDSWLCLAVLVIVWLASQGAWRRMAALMALAVCAQALVIFAVKQLVRRQRPEGEWGQIYRAVDPHSFPSGHATRAALLAVMAFGLAPLWLALLLAFWAPLVSLARVGTGVHFVSDICAGILIGALMGGLMLAFQQPIQNLLPFLF